MESLSDSLDARLSLLGNFSSAENPSGEIVIRS